MSNQGIIDALRAGLQQRPDDLALRLHLAGLPGQNEPAAARKTWQSWQERTRVTHIVMAALLVLLLLSLLFSWMLGEPIGKLMVLTAVVLVAFAGLWLFQSARSKINQRRLAQSREVADDRT